MLRQTFKMFLFLSLSRVPYWGIVSFCRIRPCWSRMSSWNQQRQWSVAAIRPCRRWWCRCGRFGCKERNCIGCRRCLSRECDRWIVLILPQERCSLWSSPESHRSQSRESIRRKKLKINNNYYCNHCYNWL